MQSKLQNHTATQMLPSFGTLEDSLLVQFQIARRGNDFYSRFGRVIVQLADECEDRVGFSRFNRLSSHAVQVTIKYAKLLLDKRMTMLCIVKAQVFIFFRNDIVQQSTDKGSLLHGLQTNFFSRRICLSRSDS